MRNTLQRLVVALLLLPLVGCGAKSAPGDLLSLTPADLAAPIPKPDGMVDLGLVPPPVFDLAWSACVGTALAGTCVERFFEHFVVCFQPAGHCYDGPHNSGDEWFWQNGAEVQSCCGVDSPPRLNTYSMGKNVCLTVCPYGPSLSSEQICRVEDAPCGTQVDDGGFNEVPTGGGARYDSQSGIFTCPDGTQVDIGLSMGGCAVLNELLNPNSTCDHVYW